MILNKLGKFTQNHVQQIPNHYPSVIINEFIIMPNHIHIILIINKQNVGQNFYFADSGQQISPESGSLGCIIRGFKIGVTKYAKENDIEFGRQPRFHEHIIRNEFEYNKIKEYIVNNPKNWKNDFYFD